MTCSELVNGFAELLPSIHYAVGFLGWATLFVFLLGLVGAAWDNAVARAAQRGR